MRTDTYWIAKIGRGELGTSPRPRGGDWLEDEVAAWRRAGVTAVVSLLTPEETKELALDEEATLCAAAGIRFHSVPIPDRGLPASRDQIEKVVDELLRDLNAGGRVVAHCRQGIGRASLLAASVLVASGEDPDRALELIESARGRPVPDTDEQAGWVRSYRAA